MSDDKFYKEIADKLSDYEMPVSDSVWEAIATSIDSVPKQKSKRRAIIYLPFAAVAVAASIVAGVFFGGKPQTADGLSSPEKMLADNVMNDSDIQVIENNSPVYGSSLLADNTITKKKPQTHIVSFTDTPEPIVKEYTIVEDDNIQPFVSIDENHVSEGNVSANEQMSSLSDNQEIIDYWASVESEEKGREKERYHHQLNASLFSSSSSATPTIGSMDYLDDLPVYSDAPNSTESIGNGYVYSSDYDFNRKQEYVAQNHRQPIRVGVSLGYSIAPSLSVESGLVWSSLHSTFKETWTNKEYSQNLQYLGVPVNLVWSFYQGDKFSFYLSGGAMLEKCISGKFGQTKIDQHPWQWSLMDAIGAQLNFSKNASLFVEPGLGYYFNDGSSLVSVYKENPTVVSLKLGLRVSLR